MLEALRNVDDTDKSANLAQLISSELKSSRWYSTQSTAFALTSIGKYMGSQPDDGLNLSWTAGDIAKDIKTQKPISNTVISNGVVAQNITVTNNSADILYLKTINRGQPTPGKEPSAAARHLSLDISYKDMDGNAIDVNNLRQGTDFVQEIKISNLGTRGYNIEEMVLNQIFPSGWEIQNSRLANAPTSCLLYTSPSPRDATLSRMPSSA